MIAIQCEDIFWSMSFNIFLKKWLHNSHKIIDLIRTPWSWLTNIHAHNCLEKKSETFRQLFFFPFFKTLLGRHYWMTLWNPLCASEWTLQYTSSHISLNAPLPPSSPQFLNVSSKTGGVHSNATWHSSISSWGSTS